jgi:saccharopine dehydrogenase (NAD+, L-lysine forming)
VEHVDASDAGWRGSGDLRIEGYTFATVLSIRTAIEEYLNPPQEHEKGRGSFTLLPFAEPERLIS